ncbi:hypothetical protein AB0M48_21765 [Lentzea sp. NPDC051208]|uniref:hypothetical protein n=1 Tax=Lentzea sp. NPDC051208 TaxID=3154642 RepID=UPI00343777C6
MRTDPAIAALQTATTVLSVLLTASKASTARIDRLTAPFRCTTTAMAAHSAAIPPMIKQ